MNQAAANPSETQAAEFLGPTLLVGLGASAGGLEPLEQFFHNVSLDTGMAFVVVQHLSPDYPSLMLELLSRHTALPIQRVEDGMRVSANAVYLIPPRMNMIVKDGVLRVTEQVREDEHPPLPIDIFFKSLAEDHGDKAVAIVLSGTGTDGSRGVKAIKEHGGLVLTQDDVTSKFAGMPRASVDTGVVDAALSPDEMPAYLVAYQNDPSSVPAAHPGDSDELEGLDAVLDLLNRHHDIDFQLYKPATVHRRIERRILLGPDQDIDTYLERLRQDPQELHRLYKDLLIGVTHFFRDAAAYDSLARHVVPEIFEGKNADEEIRIWVAGCATGEEAYSIAILMDEARQKLRRENQPIRIFATDAHRLSIEHAAAGRYSADTMREVMPDRLSRYFSPVGSDFQVAARLRQMITFAPHNLISDAPFTRMDLVTCRNVQIYFKSQVQAHVLTLLHFALDPRGFLFIGPSETTQPYSEEFETIDPHWRLYRKRRDIRLLAPSRLPTRTPAISPTRRFEPLLSHNSGSLTPDARLMRAYDVLLSKAIDAAILVNDRREVVHIFGNAGEMLRVPTGRRSSDLLSMLEDALKPSVGAAIQKARLEKKLIQLGIVPTDENAGIRVSAEPLPDTSGDIGFILIRLERVDRPVASRPPSVGNAELAYDPKGINQQAIVGLEQELQYTKENLQTTIEELETANEELNATNEELIASNEELQSTNEELHSVNEELHTVNAEYQQKITELTRLTDDMNNLLASTAIGTIFLDANLDIRRFTPAVQGLFKVREADIGRPIDEISRTFDYPDFVDHARNCLASDRASEHEVGLEDGRTLLVRFNAYQPSSGGTDGLVVTFVDVTRIKVAEERAQLERQQVQEILDTLPAMVFFKDDQNNILRANQACVDSLKMPRDAMERHNTADLFPDDAEAYLKADLDVIRSGMPKLGITEKITGADGKRRWIQTDRIPLRVLDQDRAGVVAVVTDVTELREAEAELHDITKRFDAFMRNSPAMKWAVDEEGRYMFVNPTYERLMGVQAEDCVGKHPREMLAKQTSQAFLKRSQETNTQAQEKHGPIHFEVAVPVDGVMREFYVTNFTFRDASGQLFIGGSALEITELKRVEAELKRVNEELEDRVRRRTSELTVARDQLEQRVAERTHELSVNNEALVARNHELDQFAHAASHDLRSPLRTILGFAGHLEDVLGKQNQPDADDALGRIIGAANRMADLVDSLLLFATVGRSEIRTEPVALKLALDQVLSDLSPEIESGGAEVIVPDEMPTVIGDAALLRQAMQNYVANALKYRSEASPRIVIEARSENGKCLVTVTDNGIGFPSDDAHRVFEPFQRLHEGKRYRGAGIGLSICKRVIERLGGTVWARSEVGEGSTFAFTLPLSGADS